MFSYFGCLQYFGYQAFDELTHAFIRSEIQGFSTNAMPTEINFFGNGTSFDAHKKITLPSYNLLADLIVKAMNQHQQTLEKTIEKSLTKSQCEKLNSLLEKVANSDGILGWYLINNARYYNQTRLHFANGDLSSIEFELSLLNVLAVA